MLETSSISQDEGDQTQSTSEITTALKSPTNEAPPDPPQDQPMPTEYEQLTEQLQKTPHDPESWKRLVHLVHNSGETPKIRATYEALLKQYPNTASAQIAYIGHFSDKQDTFSEAEDLFRTFLRSSPSAELCRFYLNYVRRVNTSPSTRDAVRMSYEFALDRVGQDKDAGDIWADYIQFLNSGEASTTWEQQQKMDSLRKVYHRAVQIPLENVQRLWEDLEAFEINLNRITAKKFMADLSPAHMQARQVLRELKTHVSSLYHPPAPHVPNQPPDLYLPTLPTFNVNERLLIGKWKAYLKWEESNPLLIEDKDKATFIARVQGVYRKAVIRMRYYPEFWFMAYMWTYNVGKHEEAMSILKAGMEANPSSFLLTFALAEALENEKKYPEVHVTFDKLISNVRKSLEELEAANKSANSSFSSDDGTTTVTGAPTVTATPKPEPGVPLKDSSFNSQSSEGQPSKEMIERKKEYGLLYIMYMRFGKRAEGFKSSRAIFARARKDRFTPWEVYEAAALMEYHCSEDKAVPNRIFEKGLDQFKEEVDYVQRYLGFLLSVNDETNARALFERVIGTFTPEKARPLWERWSRYEYQYGDLQAVQKLEKRIAEVYPQDPLMKRFAQRYMYLGIDAIAQRDLGVSMLRTNPGEFGVSTKALGRTQTRDSLGGSGNANTPSSATKRAASPVDYSRRPQRGDDRGEYGGQHKRQRGQSPSRGDRDRDREGSRWDGPSRRRYNSPPPPPQPPAWERESKDGGGRVPPPRRIEKEKEEEKPVVLPPVLSWFVSQLPPAAAFDGPVFRTDDLLNLFRNAVIPSTRARSPPPPPRSGGRPPPDYGPYQGPGGGSRARRY